MLFNGFKPLFAALSPERRQRAVGPASSRPCRGRAATSTPCSPRRPASRPPSPTATPSSAAPSTTSTPCSAPSTPTTSSCSAAHRPAPAVHRAGWPPTARRSARSLTGINTLSAETADLLSVDAPAHQGRRRPAARRSPRTSTSRRTSRQFENFIADAPGQASPRSPAPRPTARGSTSTSATSTPRASILPTGPLPGGHGYDVAAARCRHEHPLPRAQPVPIGAVGLLVIAVLLCPGFQRLEPAAHRRRRPTYSAAFSEAGGLKPDDDVRIAGVKVGKVDRGRPRRRPRPGRLHGSPSDAAFGPQTGASIRMKTILGQKYLALEPAGAGPARRRTARSRCRGRVAPTTSSTRSPTSPRRPSDRHRPAGQVPETSSPPSSRTARPDVKAAARRAVAACPAPSPAATTSCAGCSPRANSVTGARRRAATSRSSTLIKDADLLLVELDARRDAIHTLFLNTSALAQQLTGLVARQPGPARARPWPS